MAYDNQCKWAFMLHTGTATWKIGWGEGVGVGPWAMTISYTVYTSIGGKGRCHTRRDLRDHCAQARKSAGERSTPDLKPVRKDTRSPKQEQSVAPQNGPWSNKKILKK